MPRKATNKKRLVLLDTHALIHRAYHALPEFTSPSGDPVGAVYGLSAILIKLIKDLEPDYIVAAYDLPEPTHRHEVYEEYKAKRPKIDESLISQIDRSRDALAAFGIPIYEAPGFEADDVIGTIALKMKGAFDVVIASGDNDTLQLVDDKAVRVYTMRKGMHDTILYDEEAVLARYGFPPKLLPDYKGLAGDSSDNIIGIPGVGEKTATTLISSFGSIEEIYKTLEKSPQKFQEAGIKERVVKLLSEHEDEAAFSKVLATIRTDAPIALKDPHPFSEAFDPNACVAFFTELGFRSLVPRVKQLVSTPTTASTEAEAPEVNLELFKEAQVMLWLTQSDLTNPSLEDVLHTTKSKTLEEAHEKLSELIKKEKLERVYEEIEKPLIPVISELNDAGVLVDKNYLKDLSKEYHQELDKIAKQIFKIAGKEFNINSPKQLGEILFTDLNIGADTKRRKVTATGQISTKESELVKFKDEHPIIELILSYRELNKLLGTYIDAIPPLLGEDGRLHTTFVQTGTATGRLSSQNPNLQNIPIKTDLGRRIRKAFIAPSGRVLAAFDYSQIELRLAAFLSGDKKLTTVFKKGEDVHTAVAAEVFGVPKDKVDYEMRRRAKVINFGLLYGMGVNALRVSLGTDRAEAQDFLNRYFETYKELADYLAKTKATAARVGYTTTYFGRRRYFPGINSRLPQVRASAERMAINAPLQGTQADIVKLSMVRLRQLLHDQYLGKALLVLQIHDELIFEVEKDVLKEFATLIRQTMEHIIPKEELNGIPLTVSAEAGPTWGETEKVEQ